MFTGRAVWIAACALLALPVAFAMRCGPEFTEAGHHIVFRGKADIGAEPISCELRPSAGGLPDQCCCGPVAGAWRCLPHVIIAGAQKSGSTALFGYLTLHPQFVPPSRKELHSFDSPQWADVQFALSSYLREFPEYNPAQVRASVSRTPCVSAV